VFGSLVMGSIAAGLVARSVAPVVLVGPHAVPGSTFEAMQVCVDGPETVEPLVDAACAWTGLVRSIRVVHVWLPGDAGFHSEGDASACLDDVAHRIRARTIGADVAAELLHGDMAPASLIADAEHHGVAISAFACRRHHALGRRVIGSVTMTFAHSTSGVVLAVPY
jgi:nucleotide-binding universal stress UspA family protein